MGTFVREIVLELKVYDAVTHLNMGSGAGKNIVMEGGLDPLSYFEQESDKNADHRATSEPKKTRTVLREQKRRRPKQGRRGKTYETGSF